MQCISCDSPVISLFRCQGCDITFTDESACDVHERLTGHLCTSYFTCECRHPTTFQDYYELYNFFFQCPICGKHCASQGGLSNHENSCQVKHKVLINRE